MKNSKDAEDISLLNEALIEEIELILPGLFKNILTKFGFTPSSLTEIESCRLYGMFSRMKHLKPDFWFVFLDQKEKKRIFTMQVSASLAMSCKIRASFIDAVCAPFEGYFKPNEEYLSARKGIDFYTLERSQFSHDFIKNELEHIVYPTLRRVFLIDQLDDKFVPARD
jgi:hypothetical protein